MEGKKKLSWNIERTGVDTFRCNYIYKFSTNQWLENIDDLSDLSSYTYDEIKEILIEGIVSEFRFALNNVVFGDPTGKFYKEINYS